MNEKENFQVITPDKDYNHDWAKRRYKKIAQNLYQNYCLCEQVVQYYSQNNYLQYSTSK